jgi:REP element-mobilizing transposase RayT
LPSRERRRLAGFAQPGAPAARRLCPAGSAGGSPAFFRLRSNRLNSSRFFLKTRIDVELFGCFVRSYFNGWIKKIAGGVLMTLLETQKTISQESWHSRGYLPHYEAGQQPQMITFRLYDSLPGTVLIKFNEEVEQVDPKKRDLERLRRIEQFLDNGAGACSLSNEAIAKLTEENLLYFDQKRYALHAWVIMPNHVHILLTPLPGALLSSIVHSWKSFTAKQANEILGREGPFWQKEYFDRWIRHEQHFRDAICYIHNNPVKAGLCLQPTDWRFSSARFSCQ